MYTSMFVNHVIEKDTRRNILQKKWMFFILNTFYIYIYIYIYTRTHRYIYIYIHT